MKKKTEKKSGVCERGVQRERESKQGKTETSINMQGDTHAQIKKKEVLSPQVLSISDGVSLIY